MQKILTIAVAIVCTSAALPSHAGQRPSRGFSDSAPRPSTARSHQAEPVLNAQPWAVLLCRFADIPDTPAQPSFFEELMSDEYPGLGNYWDEVSLGKMSLAGSEVRGWFDIPGTYASYGLADATEGSTVDWKRLIEDCMGAADSTVDFGDFPGVMVMLNYRAAAAASIGQATFGFDGATRDYFTAAVPAPPASPCACSYDSAGWNNIGVIAHEMGHGMGFHHSSGPYGQTYDSHWDVMSDPSPRTSSGACKVDTTVYGCAPVHTLAHNKARAGWLSTSEVANVRSGTTTTETLHPAEIAGTGKKLAIVALATHETDPTSYLTVEVRKRMGWDQALPGEGVVIHRVSPRGLPNVPTTDALVVDPDGNGDPKDEGAIWRPGETYTDPAGATVQVLEQQGDTFVVEMSSPLPDGTINDTTTSAFTITSPRTVVDQTLSGATASSDDPIPSCVDEPLSSTVWFRFVASWGTDLVLSIEGDGFSPTMAIHRRTTEVHCVTAPANERVDVDLTPDINREYFVMVGGAEGSSGQITFQIREVVPRSVTLKLTKHLVAKGSIASSEEPCTEPGPVVIQRKNGTKWARVAGATSTVAGTFSKKLPDKAGTYRAVVIVRPLTDLVCGEGISPAGAHRH